MRGPEGVPVGELRRIMISNIVAYNVDPEQGIIIAGIPGHDIRDVELQNIKIYYKGGGTKEDAQREVPMAEKDYPEPSKFGILPAYGVYVRCAKSIKLQNLDLNFMNEEKRPAIILDHVEGAVLRFVKAQKAPGTPSLILNSTEDVNVFQSLDLKDESFKKTTRKKL
jgi:hypothetical protein